MFFMFVVVRSFFVVVVWFRGPLAFSLKTSALA